MNVTEWFDGNTTVPGQEGVYEVSKSPFRFAYWNGIFWSVASMSEIGATWHRNHRSCIQNPEWRGLKENPNEHA